MKTEIGLLTLRLIEAALKSKSVILEMNDELQANIVQKAVDLAIKILSADDFIAQQNQTKDIRAENNKQ